MIGCTMGNHFMNQENIMDLFTLLLTCYLVENTSVKSSSGLLKEDKLTKSEKDIRQNQTGKTIGPLQMNSNKTLNFSAKKTSQEK